MTEWLRFIWHETVLELRRERLIAVTTISTVAVLLVLLGANLLCVMDLHGWVDRAAKEVTVTAYLKKGLPRDKAAAVAKEVAAWPEVAEAQFVTREELWHEFSTQVVSAEQLRGLDASTFSDSVRLRAKQPALVRAVSAKLEAREDVDQVIPGTKDRDQTSSRAAKLLERIIRLGVIARWVGIVVAMLVALVGMFVVHNTIRLALHARWREIYIMQLVGATRTLIAAPFLLEGAIHGAIGAALAACVLVPVHMYLGAAALAAKSFLQLQPDTALLPFTIYFIIGGMFLGLFGSALSLWRTLRHKPQWQT